MNKLSDGINHTTWKSNSFSNCAWPVDIYCTSNSPYSSDYSNCNTDTLRWWRPVSNLEYCGSYANMRDRLCFKKCPYYIKGELFQQFQKVLLMIVSHTQWKKQNAHHFFLLCPLPLQIYPYISYYIWYMLPYIICATVSIPSSPSTTIKLHLDTSK